MKALILGIAVLLAMGIWAADETKGGSAEDRKREFATIQKELEAGQPDREATKEQIQAYVELATEKYGKFARSNPQTPEGFEAAFRTAGMLFNLRSPGAMEYVELAATIAPPAGVDVKRVSQCWAVIASDKLQKQDIKGAREAAEKVKPLNKDAYEQISAQVESAERLQPGKEPFPIEEKDIEGNAFSLAGWKGKVVVIDFWAPWCGPCMAEMPNLKKLYEEQHAHGLEVVGVSLDKDEAELKNTLQQQGMTWTILSDHGAWKNAIARKWGVQSIPKTIVLDREGVIRYVDLRGQQLDQAVEKLIEEKK